MTNIVVPATIPSASLPLHIPALADDTPSRHPCKIRIPSAQKRFMFDPYKAQVTLGLEGGSDASSCDDVISSDSDDGVNDDAFGNSSTATAAAVHHDADVHPAPKPVDSSSPTMAGGQARHRAPFACRPNVAKEQEEEACSDSSLENPGCPQRRTADSPQPVLQDGTQRGLSCTSPTPSSLPFSRDGSSAAHIAGAHYTNADGCYRLNAGNVHHALVRFKFSEDVYVVPLCDRRSLCVGDLVVVEGDRGENIGQVMTDLSSQYDEKDLSQKPIVRRALNKDRKKFYHARRKDALASKAAQQLVQENGLKMHVLDAEFQSDLMKLTIYFRSFAGGESIDFREMQRGMFKQFRCRIWLVNWDEDKHLQQMVQQQIQHAPHATPVGTGATITADAAVPSLNNSAGVAYANHTVGGAAATYVSAGNHIKGGMGASAEARLPQQWHAYTVSAVRNTAAVSPFVGGIVRGEHAIDGRGAATALAPFRVK